MLDRDDMLRRIDCELAAWERRERARRRREQGRLRRMALAIGASGKVLVACGPEALYGIEEPADAGVHDAANGDTEPVFDGSPVYGIDVEVFDTARPDIDPYVSDAAYGIDSGPADRARPDIDPYVSDAAYGIDSGPADRARPDIDPYVSDSAYGFDAYTPDAELADVDPWVADSAYMGPWTDR